MSGETNYIKGTATYEGPAAGRYVMKTLTSDGNVDTIMDGQFTAMSTLTADFGGPDIATNNQFMLRGTVHDFMDGQDPLGFQGGDVTLGAKTITANGLLMS